MTTDDLRRLAAHTPHLARRILRAPIALAAWLLRPPDEPACRFANHTNEDN